MNPFLSTIKEKVLLLKVSKRNTIEAFPTNITFTHLYHDYFMWKERSEKIKKDQKVFGPW